MSEKASGFIEKNAARADLEKVLPLAMPYGLCIEPTNHCNLKCRFCPVSLDEFPEVVGGRRFIAWSLYEKIIEDVAAMGRLNNLNLYGDGEPFLNKRLIDMICLARQRDVANYINVTTNALALTPGTSRQLLESGLSFLRVSVYGIDRKKFNHITKSRVDPLRVVENLRTLKSLRDAAGLEWPRIYVKMIESSYNREEIPRFKALYSEVADEVNIEHPINWNGYNELDLIGALDPGRQVDQHRVQGFHRNAGADGRKQICTTPFLSLNVKSDGKVVICIVDWNKGTEVGDINQESLAQIWSGERLREFRRMHIEGRRRENPSCRNCKVLYNSPDNIDALALRDPDRLLGPSC